MSDNGSILPFDHRSGEPVVRPAPMRNADAPWFRRWGQPASSPGSSGTRHAWQPQCRHACAAMSGGSWCVEVCEP
jgi:hypothetical protein